MAITTVLFDLDGTLLPMDQDEFVKAYLGLLTKKLAPHGYDPKKLIDGIWTGTGAMVKNSGGRKNEDVFWDTFCAIMGENARKDEPLFREFYENEFSGAKAVCGFDPKAAQTIALVKAKGFRAALATNPIFPAIATEQRIVWAGLSPADFEIVTTYENSCHSKPNPDYYREVMDRLGVTAEECVMVGNDVGEDMVAEKLGMRVFLLTDCLINRKGADIEQYPHGGFDALMTFIEAL
ncbi:MAG: HAD hydrolase-like protein [Oscillospiraceae bacterium]|nr:HAD hydrolase-like protein [Oscillospiraceae bacterium]